MRVYKRHPLYLADVRDIVSRVGANYAHNLEVREYAEDAKGRLERFTIRARSSGYVATKPHAFEGLSWRCGKRRCGHERLGHDLQWVNARPPGVSAPGARCSWSGKRTVAACWHAHRDVLRAIFTAYPDARISTSMADYRGLEGFERAYRATARRNIGSMMQPAYMPQLCDCIESADTESSITHLMPQSTIGGCPFYILDPTHYLADGSACKCRHAAEQSRMVREWEYTREDFEAHGIPYLLEGVS